MFAQLIKFGFTGVINTLIDFGVFNLLIILTGTHSTLSVTLFNTLAVTLAVTNSFILNRSWTFAHHNRKNGQLQRFIIASLIGIFINSLTVSLIADWQLLTAFTPLLVLNFAKVMGALLSTTWNFLSYRNWVFRAQGKPVVFQPEGFIPGLVSVIIPAYNEKSRLPQRLEQLAANLPQHWPVEIIVVDDGSRDNTPKCIQGFEAKYPFIRSLQHQTNQGKGAAVRFGMLNSRGEYLIYTDADETYTPEHIIMLAEKLRSSNKVFIACREVNQRERLAGESFLRKWQGKCFNLLVQMILLPGVKDSQCGLKGFTRDVAGQIFPLQRIKGFAFDVEILALLRKLKIPVEVIPVTSEDCPGSTVRSFYTPIGMAWDLVKIKCAFAVHLYNLPHDTIPANRWVAATGLFLAALMVRIPWLWEVPRYIDELKEVKLAYQIYKGETFPLHNMAQDIGSLHNYILAGIFKLMGASIYWPRLYVAVTSALTVVLIYYIGKKLFGHWVGITAAVLLLGNGMHILVTHMAWSNCTTPFFFCLAFLSLLQAEDKKSGFWLVISALFWALTLQTHSSVIIYVIAVLLYIIRPGFRYHTAIKSRYYIMAGIGFALAYSNMIYFNLVSKGGSFNWLRYKGYAIEKSPGLSTYLTNLKAMFVELIRSLSPTYANEESFLTYFSNPQYTVIFLLLLLGAFLAFRRKKHLPLYMILSSFLFMPWINHRYVFFVATRYIMPVIICSLLLISLGLVYVFTYVYELLGKRRVLMVPAVSTLFLLMLIQLIPFYTYCARTANTNQSNRLALQVFQKTMELSDQRSTLVVLDNSLRMENDPLPYLLTLAGQPFMVSNADILASSTNIQDRSLNIHNYRGKKIVGIISAGEFRELRTHLSPQEIDSYSCKLTMPASARGERKVYVLDLGSYRNSAKKNIK